MEEKKEPDASGSLRLRGGLGGGWFGQETGGTYRNRLDLAGLSDDVEFLPVQEEGDAAGVAGPDDYLSAAMNGALVTRFERGGAYGFSVNRHGKPAFFVRLNHDRKLARGGS